MEYRPFGKTGVQVSIMGYGAMRLPTLEDGTCDVEKSLPLLRRGIDLGINYIDTAYVYIKGTSEVAVGQAIKGYERESLHLATKIPIHGEEDAKPHVWHAKTRLCQRTLFCQRTSPPRFSGVLPPKTAPAKKATSLD